MRLPLAPTPACQLQLASPPNKDDPPLVFIDNEPFILELQGILEAPPGTAEEAQSEGRSEMEGVRVGKVDLSDPKKPILRIAHHRLEGKLETLLTPYALLRTTRTPSSADSTSAAASTSAKRPIDDSVASDNPPSAKRLKPDPSRPSASSSSDPPASTQIRIISLIRRKIVFSRRPEPLIEVSSEADPGFVARERAKGIKPHALAMQGGPGGAVAGPPPKGKKK
ncbi:hypothetical protein JCM10213_006201 [Rhodosporidiobolus nylandii]